MKEHHEEPQAGKELRAAGATNGSANGDTRESAQARGLSQTMRDPARRKRNASQKTKSRANGHGGESSSLTESPNGTKTNGNLDGSSLPAALAGLPEREPAASDDATGTTLAGDPAPTAAACTGRDACAEVAAPRSRSSAVRGEKSGTADDRRPRACDDSPLAYDAPGFVAEMHARVNLYAEYEKLLETEDLKIKQRALELLLEMKYGRGAPTSADESPLRLDVEFPKSQ